MGGLRLGETGSAREVARVLLHQCGTAETCPSENHVGGCEKVLMTVAPTTSACSVGDLFLAKLRGAEECREGR